MSNLIIKLKEFSLTGTNNLNSEDINEVAEYLRRNAEVKDRKYRLKTYRDCFLGSEAVSLLMKEFNIMKREDAQALGQLVMDVGVFSHVVDNEAFEDGFFFYRFNSPEVMDTLKKERSVFQKQGFLVLEKKMSSPKYWFELNDTILRYRDKPRGKVKGKFNIAGANICDIPTNRSAFQVKVSKGSTLVLKAEDETQKNQWVNTLCKTSERVTENDKLIELWKADKDPCIACMAAFAAEQAQMDKEQSNTLSAENAEQSKGEEIKTQDSMEMKSESKLSDLLEELYGLEIADINDQQKKLGDVFLNHDTVVLALLRHFGKSASELTSLKPELDKLGIGLVAIGSGTPMMAKSFQEEFKFPGTMFVDRKRLVFKSLGCNRGITYTLAPKTFKAAKQALSEGFAQGSTQGDALQLGGAFILSKKDGLVYQYLEEFAGDHPDNEELLKFCRDYRKK